MEMSVMGFEWLPPSASRERYTLFSHVSARLSWALRNSGRFEAPATTERESVGPEGSTDSRSAVHDGLLRPAGAAACVLSDAAHRHPSPDHETPDHDALDQLALDQLALDQLALDQLALDQLALDQLPLDQYALDQYVSGHDAPDHLPPDQVTPLQEPPDHDAPLVSSNSATLPVAAGAYCWTSARVAYQCRRAIERASILPAPSRTP
jgi:hypothetical protein